MQNKRDTDTSRPLKKRLILNYIKAVTDLSSDLPDDQICQVVGLQMARMLESDFCLLVYRPPCLDDGPLEGSSLLQVSRTAVSMAGDVISWTDTSIRAVECPWLAYCVQEPLVYQTGLDGPGMSAADRAYFGRLGAQRLLAAPVFYQDQMVALMVVVSGQAGRVFSDQDTLLAHVIASQAGAFISLSHVNRDLARRSHEMEILYQSTLAVTASLDLDQVLNTILKNAFSLAPARDTQIFLYDGEHLHFAAALWSDGSTGKPWSQPRPEGMTYTVARSGEMIFVPNMRDHPIFRNAPPEWHGSIIGLPLKIGQRVVGVMTMAFDETRQIGESEQRMLRMLGDQAAISIENARLHNIINQQAHTDPLTGLPNRRSLDERLAEEVRRSSRYDHPFVLAMLDIDRFKHINDTFGHPAGDEALKQLAACLRGSIRDTDFVARYGGDEFVLLLPETDRETARALVKRLQALATGLEPRYLAFANGSSVPVHEQYSLSAGVAVFPDEAAHAEALLTAADLALYQDKRSKTATPA
jgi:diguanylate cyclase (GGDEF)-like protein